MANPGPEAAAQLALGVQLRDDATLDNFLAPDSIEPLLSLLREQSGEQGETLIYLCGPRDSGKSHLLQGACHAAGGDAAYLPLAIMADYPPGEVLAELHHRPLLCLDDLQAVAGRPDWERELFAMFNAARDRGVRLLVSADCPPRRLALELADLRSRLAWGVVYALPAANDDRRAAILSFRARRRGIDLSAEVCRYILGRAPRGLGSLLEVLETLDRASLAQQRALSIPFVKATMGW